MSTRRKLLLGLLIVAGLFVSNYIFGWFQAKGLSEGYLQDAEVAYARGDYLNALTGHKEFDRAQGKYVQRGGFLQVERIWSSPYAWPRPDASASAQARVQEIISERLTIAMAEAFIQANIGKSNPYLGIIYLRLGELYEQSGDRVAAREVYQIIVESFASEPQWVAQAQDHLARLTQPTATPAP